MTWASRAFALFPSMHGALCLASLAWGVVHPSAAAVAGLLLAAYGVGPLCYRALLTMSPIAEGPSRLDVPRFSPWWASHQIQGIYIALPALEAMLRLVPGAYSAWLRLWGSRVGRGVYWTPRVEIHDRGLMEIGDRVIFGHKVECYAHVIKPKDGRLLLYVKRISIGDGAFIGAGSRMASGVRIAAGAEVPLLTDIYPNGTFPPSPVAEPVP